MRWIVPLKQPNPHGSFRGAQILCKPWLSGSTLQTPSFVAAVAGQFSRPATIPRTEAFVIKKPREWSMGGRMSWIPNAFFLLETLYVKGPFSLTIFFGKMGPVVYCII